MNRREIIALLGGAAMLPVAARGQQPGRARRVVVVSGYAESDGEAQARMAGFLANIAGR
jgi:putative tryptophan/tyrosine transport system substrate-binding protein